MASTDPSDPYGNFEWLASKRRRMDADFLPSQSHRNQIEMSKSGNAENSLKSKLDSRVKMRGHVIKSKLDAREYHAFVLPNRMRVLVVSDPLTDKSAAALSIQAGSMLDPKEMQGLAHLCEHMLFAGNNRSYPDHDKTFDAFLDQHNGVYSSFTQKDVTTHAFEVSSGALKESIDRFAQYFTVPSFPESAIEDKIALVQAEFERRRGNDDERRNHIASALSKLDHSFSNRDTLWTRPLAQGLNIHRELLKFYNNFYSANLMCLVLLGKESLGELETMAVTNFSRIEDTHKIFPRWVEPPYGHAQHATRIEIEPLAEIKRLFLVFPIPDYSGHYKTGTIPYVRFILNFEGPGSLVSFLKREQLILKADVDYEQPGSGFAFLTINFHLTDLGLERHIQIVQHLFQYLKTIEKDGPQLRIWKEMKIINETKFHYLIPEEPLDFVENLVTLMPVVPESEILSCRYILGEYKPQLIRELIRFLSPASVRIIISARAKENQNPGLLFSIDEYYGVKYTYSDIEDEILLNWHECKLNPEFKSPPPNPFIATTHALKERDLHITEYAGKTINFPRLLQDTDLSQVWFLQDTVFNIPKATIILVIISELPKHGPVEYNMTRLVAKVVEDSLQEFSSSAHAAGLAYSIEGSMSGLTLTIHGYDGKLGILFTYLLNRLFHFISYGNVGPRFQCIVKDYMNHLLQWTRQEPSTHALEYLEQLLTSHAWHAQDLFEAMVQVGGENMSSSKLVTFAQQYFSRIKLKWFFHGNLTELECLEIHQSGIDYFECIKAKSLHAKGVAPSREVILSAGVPYFFEEKHPTSSKSATVILLQCGIAHARETVMLELIESILSEPLTNLLNQPIGEGPNPVPEPETTTNNTTASDNGNDDDDKDEKQIWTDVRKSRGTISLVIVVQAKKDPGDLEETIENFLNGISAQLHNLSPEEFLQYKLTLAVNKTQKGNSLLEKGAFLFQEILKETFEFDRENMELLELQKMNQEQVSNFYDNNIAPKGCDRKKLCVHVLSSSASFKRDSTKVLPSFESQQTSLRSRCRSVTPDGKTNNDTNRNKIQTESRAEFGTMTAADSGAMLLNSNPEDMTTYFTSANVTSSSAESQSQSVENLAFNTTVPNTKKKCRKKKGPTLTVSKKRITIRCGSSKLKSSNNNCFTAKKSNTNTNRSRSGASIQSRHRPKCQRQHLLTPTLRSSKYYVDHEDDENKENNNYSQKSCENSKFLAQNLIELTNNSETKFNVSNSSSKPVDADNNGNGTDGGAVTVLNQSFKDYYVQVEEEIKLLSNLKNFLFDEMNKDDAISSTRMKSTTTSSQENQTKIDNFKSNNDKDYPAPEICLQYLEGPGCVRNSCSCEKCNSCDSDANSDCDNDSARAKDIHNFKSSNCFREGELPLQIEKDRMSTASAYEFEHARRKQHLQKLLNTDKPQQEAQQHGYSVYTVNSLVHDFGNDLDYGRIQPKKRNLQQQQRRSSAKILNTETVLQPHDRYVVKIEPKVSKHCKNDNEPAEKQENLRAAHGSKSTTARAQKPATERKQSTETKEVSSAGQSQKKDIRCSPSRVRKSSLSIHVKQPLPSTIMAANANNDSSVSTPAPAAVLAPSVAKLHEVNELKELDFDIKNEIRRLQKLRKLLDTKAKLILHTKDGIEIETDTADLGSSARDDSFEAAKGAKVQKSLNFYKRSNFNIQSGPESGSGPGEVNKEKHSTTESPSIKPATGKTKIKKANNKGKEINEQQEDGEGTQSQEVRDIDEKNANSIIAVSHDPEKEEKPALAEVKKVEKDKSITNILNNNVVVVSERDSKDGASKREDGLIDWIRAQVKSKTEEEKITRAKLVEASPSRIKSRSRKVRPRSPPGPGPGPGPGDGNPNSELKENNSARVSSKSRSRTRNYTDTAARENNDRYTNEVPPEPKTAQVSIIPNYDAFVMQASIEYSKLTLPDINNVIRKTKSRSKKKMSAGAGLTPEPALTQMQGQGPAGLLLPPLKNTTLAQVVAAYAGTSGTPPLILQKPKIKVANPVLGKGKLRLQQHQTLVKKSALKIHRDSSLNKNATAAAAVAGSKPLPFSLTIPIPDMPKFGSEKARAQIKANLALGPVPGGSGGPSFKPMAAPAPTPAPAVKSVVNVVTPKQPHQLRTKPLLLLPPSVRSSSITTTTIKKNFQKSSKSTSKSLKKNDASASASASVTTPNSKNNLENDSNSFAMKPVKELKLNHSSTSILDLNILNVGARGGGWLLEPIDEALELVDVRQQPTKHFAEPKLKSDSPKNYDNDPEDRDRDRDPLMNFSSRKHTASVASRKSRKKSNKSKILEQSQPQQQDQDQPQPPSTTEFPEPNQNLAVAVAAKNNTKKHGKNSNSAERSSLSHSQSLLKHKRKRSRGISRDKILNHELEPTSKRSSTVTFSENIIVSAAPSVLSSSSAESNVSSSRGMKMKTVVKKTQSFQVVGPGIDILGSHPRRSSNSKHKFNHVSLRSRSKSKISPSSKTRTKKKSSNGRRMSSRSSSSISFSIRMGTTGTRGSVSSVVSDSSQNHSRGRSRIRKGGKQICRIKSGNSSSSVSLKPSNSRSRCHRHRSRRMSTEKINTATAGKAAQLKSNNSNHRFRMQVERKSKSSINLVGKRSSKTLKSSSTTKKRSSSKLLKTSAIAITVGAAGASAKHHHSSSSNLYLRQVRKGSSKDLGTFSRDYYSNSDSAGKTKTNRKSNKEINITQLKVKVVDGIDNNTTPETVIARVRSKSIKSRKISRKKSGGSNSSNVSLRSDSKTSHKSAAGTGRKVSSFRIRELKIRSSLKPQVKSKTNDAAPLQHHHHHHRKSGPISNENEIPLKSTSNVHRRSNAYFDSETANGLTVDNADPNRDPDITIAWKNVVKQEQLLSNNKDPDSLSNTFYSVKRPKVRRELLPTRVTSAESSNSVVSAASSIQESRSRTRHRIVTNKPRADRDRDRDRAQSRKSYVEQTYREINAERDRNRLERERSAASRFLKSVPEVSSTNISSKNSGTDQANDPDPDPAPPVSHSHEAQSDCYVGRTRREFELNKNEQDQQDAMSGNEIESGTEFEMEGSIELTDGNTNVNATNKDTATTTTPTIISALSLKAAVVMDSLASSGTGSPGFGAVATTTGTIAATGTGTGEVATAAATATVASIVSSVSARQPQYRDPVVESIVRVQSYRAELIRDIKKWRKSVNYYPPPGTFKR